ncbi:hypothetical protein [Methanocella sp. MCL-LM]|uniref:hypothetical protein n=1 Tax=Methanocella sp. MCL-LM TaxID=3412035 RepID=UPI003C70B64E
MDEAALRRLGAWFCVAALAVYVLCTIVSIIRFGQIMHPLSNWISDLGSTTINPDGALVYNAGLVLTGLLMIPFVLSFGTWHIGPGWSRYTLILAEIVGLGFCLGMILLGIFSEESGTVHLRLSELVYATLTLMILLVNVALLRNVRYKLWIIPVWGFVAFLLNCGQIVLYLMGYKPILFIWLSVYFSLGWILLFCYNALATRAPDLVETRHKIL